MTERDRTSADLFAAVCEARTFVDEHRGELPGGWIHRVDQGAPRLAEAWPISEIVAAWNETPEEIYERPLEDVPADEREAVAVARLAGRMGIAMAILRKARASGFDGES